MSAFSSIDEVVAPLKAFNGHNDKAIELITRCKEGGRHPLIKRLLRSEWR